VRVRVIGPAEGLMRTVMVSLVPNPPGWSPPGGGFGAGVPDTGGGDGDPGAALDAGVEAWSLGWLVAVPWSFLQPASVSAVTIPGTTMAVLPSLDRDCLMTIRLRPVARGSVGGVNPFNDSLPGVAAAAVPEDGYLLDVREADEWRAGHAPQAVHIPMSELNQRAREVPSDRDVYVICRSGVRSAQAVAAFNNAGWTTANVEGGMHAWEAAGRPMVSESGTDPFVA
jgi:rhodanese-related sulfurtransferase